MENERKGVVGKVVMRPLKSVQPNDWNPNGMSAVEYESLKAGLRDDGWFASQALLIWGTDEKGEQQNKIIDGEHKHRAALELKWTKGPMVVIDGITRDEARQLTIKLFQKRGKPDKSRLGSLLRDIQERTKQDQANMSKNLGFTASEMERLLKPPQISTGKTKGEGHSKNAASKTVPLFMSPDTKAQFDQDIAELSERLETDNVTDTVLEAVRIAVSETKK